MSQLPAKDDDLVPLGEAERLCRETLGMSPERFRHELAEHVRCERGLPWVAGETAAGVSTADLDAFLRNSQPCRHQETSDA